MAKKELKEQLKSYEGYINDIPLVIDPCKMCKHKDHTQKAFQRNYDIEICKECCWWYPSKFEMGIDDNYCATCRHKEKMLTDKKPCKDCDNGCNWEK